MIVLDTNVISAVVQSGQDGSSEKPVLDLPSTYQSADPPARSIVDRLGRYGESLTIVGAIYPIAAGASAVKDESTSAL